LAVAKMYLVARSLVMSAAWPTERTITEPTNKTAIPAETPNHRFMAAPPLNDE